MSERPLLSIQEIESLDDYQLDNLERERRVLLFLIVIVIILHSKGMF